MNLGNKTGLEFGKIHNVHGTIKKKIYKALK